jgi:hypothetical protein
MRKFKDAVSIEFSGADKDGPWSRFQHFSFEAILPMPKELKNVKSPVIIMTEAEIETYKKEHSNSEWCLDNLPITQEASDRLDELYDENNWYDWANTNWGVKWDACDVQVDEEFGDTEITYRFDTPWGPPNEIYTLLVAKFPEVHISWFWDEPGTEVAGYLKQK